MFSRLSSRVWGASMRSSNTAMCVSIESRPGPADGSILAKQGCRSQTRGAYPMVDQVEGQRNDSQCKRQSGGGSEAREVDTVCVAHTSSPRPKLTVHRSLEEIERRSDALSGKGKTARILDKTQDSQAIIKLVEDLRQAILIYQVGVT